jgi:uncharacterized protein with von Willebrand factor type A (vWA) domain
MALITALDRLIEELRDIGLPISISEKIDATAALGRTDLADREAVKTALAVTLVKSSEHESAFDTVFDVFFGLAASIDAAAGPLAGTDEGPGAGGDDASGIGSAQISNGGGFGGLDDAAIKSRLLDSLDQDDRGSLLQRELAGVVVERHAGIQSGRPVAGTYYLFRAMRALDPGGMLHVLVERAEERNPAVAGDGLLSRLLIEDLERRIVDFRLVVEAEIRRRLVADRGANAVAKTLRRPLPEDIDFLTAATAQLEQLHVVLQPLSRKLAARMVQKRKHHRRGAVNFRKTIRGSLSTGGLPITVHYHGPRPAKPELVVLADISGSVSAFAAFTLQLTFALRNQFSRVRCYVFVDGLDEVSSLLETSRNIIDVTTEINRQALGVWFDGRSDYGNAIETFWRLHGKELRTRATVLVLGDARSNYREPRADILAKIAGRAGHLFWLNPESKTAWDSGDSVIGRYAAHCDEVVECRNLRQLRAFVERLS